MDIHSFWKAVVLQNKDALSAYFSDDAVIRWPCTNEQFTVSEYIKANCEYPGNWDGVIERVEIRDELIITAVRIYPTDKSSSFHVVSFIELRKGLISKMDEYWADDGEAPLWRRDMNIGQPIR